MQSGGAPLHREREKGDRDDRSVASGGSGGSGSKRGGGSSTNRPAEDLAKGKDTIFTTKVMKFMLKQHPQWHNLGLAYDCGSSLYTSAKLDFPEEDSHARAPSGADVDLDYTSRSCSSGFTEGPQYEYDVVWPNSTEISLKVVIAPVSHIVPPIVGKRLHICHCCAVDAPLSDPLYSLPLYHSPHLPCFLQTTSG